MSLVSHGDIRYEGTLYTIDMPNSTIALSNVRCFGTEGRRKENQVPPSDQVFEYVVFKGSEIKELTEAFDFEEALKRFNKDEIVKEAEEEHVAVAPKEGAYVKDDFFDQLSCDTLERLHLQEEGEREDWRAKMAAQRKVDVETFGGMGVSRNRNYRYGRGRGRGYGRGRGGGRGGRGQQMSQPAQ
ncbi:hypothetical protein COHA_000996 [Chlorella ohadii]|uniref:DFDF domain-containing protein n=1 Tax=Chlorella ohadii TaxID=2649997 RepID=A0AAD5DZU0_9CHLO|nr:hypothetical protein COHA_000996 [Chlorella ohadii]